MFDVIRDKIAEVIAEIPGVENFVTNNIFGKIAIIFIIGSLVLMLFMTSMDSSSKKSGKLILFLVLAAIGYFVYKVFI